MTTATLTTEKTTPTDRSGPLPQRRFGKTEERVPVLGLGTAPAGMGLPDAEAISLFHAAIDRGVTYLDTAPGYARAQVQLGEVLPTRRDEVFLATKCATSTAEEALRIHEQSLRDLRTDCVDLLYAHCIGDMDVEQILGPDGVFAGLWEARRRGWTRYIGFTAHNRTWKSVQVLERALAGDLELDAVMLAMNYADRHTYGFQDRVLPLASSLDLGVACMKVYGGAKEMNYEVNRVSALGERSHHPAFRYALGLPDVSLAVVGMFTLEELDRNIAWARHWEPLTAEELETLDTAGQALAGEWGAHFGPVE